MMSPDEALAALTQGAAQIITEEDLRTKLALGRPLLLGHMPDAWLLHVAVLVAYGLAGFAVALALFRRRLLS